MTLKSGTVSAFLVLACFLFLASSAKSSGQCEGHAVLNRFERDQFLEVFYGKRAEISAQLLAAPGCGAQMLDTLGHLGAKINFADKLTGYALVTIPRDKLLDTLDIAGIEYAYTRNDDRLYYQDPDAKIPQSDRKPEPVPQIEIPYPKVAMTLPKDGPYFDAAAIGLPELWKDHPEADGRGVRVAVPDAGFDLLHPALQQGRDAAGKIVPKVADLGGMTTFDEDPGWVQFGQSVTTHGGSFEAAGRAWTAPEDGTYRFGIFKSTLVLGPGHNTHVKKIALSVGVLWNPQSKQVWVDTDGDGSFKNQRALGDYALNHDIDWFGAKTGDADNRIPFGVKIDTAKDAVYIRIGGDHGALVSGPLAANTLTGGLFNGAAPSAQLVDQNIGRATLVASMVAMAARPDVDVVNRSGGIARAGYTGLREGIEDFAQRVLDRTIAVYGKPMACFCDAAGTIFVDDFAGAEMLRRNRQLPPPYRDTINGGISGRPDGLVNTVLAPSANLETESRYDPLDVPWPDGRKHSFADNSFDPPAPDGYVMGANNSPTIPVVSGVLADLISEARREHIRFNATRLNNAIFTGTRLLEGFPLSMQGYGLVNAARSWEQLAKMAKADDPGNPELTSFTLSRMEGGEMVEVEGFHADLAKSGEKVDGEIWITRRGGYAGGRKYIFSLRGNDGSYELLDHGATLIRDTPTRVRFRTNGASGWNIVFLELRDAKADVVMQDVPLSVRVPDVPEKIAPGVDKYESTIPPLRSEYRYVHVGEDVMAARYTIRIPYTASLAFFPGGQSETHTAPPGKPVDAAHHVGPMETLESLVPNDEPGTQRIFWENRGRPEYTTQYDGLAPDVSIHATLTVTKYTVVIAKTQAQTISVTNQLADVEGHVEMYDAKIATSSALRGKGNHAMADVERDVPANLAQWRARVTGVTAGAHADAYLFNCTGKSGCSVFSQQEITDKGALLVVNKPQAGRWKIVVRSREQVAVEPIYKLNEAEVTPTQTGAVGMDAKHGSGEKWAVVVPNTIQYAAFRIAGTPGVEREKNGLLIAMTPLDADAP